MQKGNLEIIMYLHMYIKMTKQINLKSSQSPQADIRNNYRN